MPACINLRETYGDRYRIAHEESYAAEHPQFRAEEEPWLQVIPCRHGHIYPGGGDLLMVSTSFRGRIAHRLMALPFAEVVQDGSDGVNATFPADRLDEVAEIMGARRRRVMSPEQRAACVDRLRRFQFFSAQNRSSEAQERAQSGQDDSQPIPDTSA